MTTAAQRRFWTQIVDMGCLICAGDAEIAHLHGGSLVPIIGVKAKGKKIPRLNWIVAPLCPYHHRLGPFGDALDLGVAVWELRHGDQSDLIDELIRRTGLPLWELAKEKK